MSSTAFNPLSGMGADDLGRFLRALTIFDVNDNQRRLMERQIDALAPALVELSKASGVELNVSMTAFYAQPDGFAMLANDERLSQVTRDRCTRVCEEMARAHSELSLRLMVLH